MPDKPSSKAVDDLLGVLQKHLEPEPLEIAKRFHFYQRVQSSGESVAQFLAELCHLAIHCQFGIQLENAL